jgi:hypothetical protein
MLFPNRRMQSGDSWKSAQSYVQAATALIQFRREVETRSREVLRSRLDEYSDSLGLPLVSDMMVEWSNHLDKDW